ncbi:MAG TPA: hypothetical protein PKH06_01205 [Candidatus Dojkabacteria bacterium]|nr:hypothetical protein [Candidatus Dojkabacteria bacterium]
MLLITKGRIEMANMCSYCEDTQYCCDCLKEQGKLRSHSPVREKDNTVRICGDSLHHNGRSFKIIKQEIGSPNIKIFTKEGLLFFIRRKNNKITLIKTQNLKENQQKPECKECYNILVGPPIPPQLLQDPNW